jgi:hypothetical protein
MMSTLPLAQKEPEGIFFSRVSREFHAYWQSLSQRRGGVPFRSDLDPADIPSLLPHLFIVERIKSTGRYHFRLSGTGIRDIMGIENTNHFLDELLHGEDLNAVSAMFEQVMEQGVCIRSVEGITYSDRSYLRVEILRLPLLSGDGESCLVIGCLSRIGDDCRPGSIASMVKDKQVIQIENDVQPRSTF